MNNTLSPRAERDARNMGTGIILAEFRDARTGLCVLAREYESLTEAHECFDDYCRRFGAHHNLITVGGW